MSGMKMYKCLVMLHAFTTFSSEMMPSRLNNMNAQPSSTRLCMTTSHCDVVALTLESHVVVRCAWNQCQVITTTSISQSKTLPPCNGGGELCCYHNHIHIHIHLITSAQYQVIAKTSRKQCSYSSFITN